MRKIHEIQKELSVEIENYKQFQGEGKTEEAEGALGKVRVLTAELNEARTIDAAERAAAENDFSQKEKKELQQGIKRWLDRIESHYGVKPILYTSYKFKTRYLDDSIFNAYPYWIAHYYVDSVKYQGKWNFWQHTDVGNVPGIKEDVDLNVFNGTLEELKKLTIK